MLHIQYFTPLGLVQLVCSPFLSSIMVTFPFLLTKFDGFAIIWVDKETAFLQWEKGLALYSAIRRYHVPAWYLQK